MTPRERVLKGATAKDGFPESSVTAALNGAVEALRIAREQIMYHYHQPYGLRFDQVIDHLLSDLQGGQQEPDLVETEPRSNSDLDSAIADIEILRQGASNIESSEKETELMLLWRGKNIAYETVLRRLRQIGSGTSASMEHAVAARRSAAPSDPRDGDRS